MVLFKVRIAIDCHDDSSVEGVVHIVYIIYLLWFSLIVRSNLIFSHGLVVEMSPLLPEFILRRQFLSDILDQLVPEQYCKSAVFEVLVKYSSYPLVGCWELTLFD